jgi:Bacterial type II and III secretion system protein
VSVARIVLLLLVTVAAARADEVEIIRLKFRTAEQLIPTLRQLVEPDGAVTGVQDSLVIRASRNNILELRRVIATLDRAPRRLLISVRRDSALADSERGAGASGTVRSGGVRVGVNEPLRREDGIALSAYDVQEARAGSNMSQVQVLEGHPAYIAAGQSVPIPHTIVAHTPRGTITQSTTISQDLSTGFRVIPRLSGDQVFLDIAPQSATAGRFGPGSVNTHGLSTTASGPLGEWFPLGGIDQSAARSRSGILQGASSARTETSTIWVKVEELQ